MSDVFRVNSESDAESENLEEQNNTRTLAGRRSKLGLVAVGITGTIVAGLFVGAFPFLTPALRQICLPYVPATSSQVNNILRMCKGKPGSLVDLGSGDGRVVLAAAQAGFHAVGYELNLWLVLYSKLRARLLGLHHKASFFRADLWKINLREFDNIVIFGVDEMMPKLQAKFAAEIKPDARILACRFPLPDWKPEAVICAGIDTVWLYRKRNSTDVAEKHSRMENNIQNATKTN